MKPAQRSTREAYHHGDLRRQLVAATEAIISERGVDGFTLREAARRAGVSPAAPAHHFKDARGLLTEVALLGFRDFGDALEAADQRGGSDPRQRLIEQAGAYVRFALRYPARFQLMFRHEKHDPANAEYTRLADRAYRILEDAIRAAAGVAPDQPLTPDGHGLLMSVWSMVHGFSHLALGGELQHFADDQAVEDLILGSLLPLTLKHLPVHS